MIPALASSENPLFIKKFQTFSWIEVTLTCSNGIGTLAMGIKIIDPSLGITGMFGFASLIAAEVILNLSAIFSMVSYIFFHCVIGV
ncbi:hypothetical protein ACM6Q7_08235 [Peribacillus butanolivorans]